MKMYPFLALTQLILLFFATITAASSSPDRFFKPSLSSHPDKPQQYFELAPPLPADHLSPACSLPVILHSFADTINRPPFTTSYVPPSSGDCVYPWSYVTLQFRAKCRGDQYDRISAIWLGGVELLRTSTAEPTKNGIYWEVRKDITRYSSLLRNNDLNFTMMLENVVNSVYTGVYHVEVTLLFFKDHNVTFPATGNELENGIRLAPSGIGSSKRFEEYPADLIIPVSSDNGVNCGYWFKIEGESDVIMRNVRFPNNTRKAVLELYVSFHGNDEFWYSNPPDSYIKSNGLSTSRGGGPYREVFVTIDGKIVGSEVPFPVVFTGGINPLFWEPYVGIGAFNLPSYDFDLSPFLGMVLDGKDHLFGISITEGISYWLVNANLHIWLDGASSSVEAKSVVYDNPEASLSRNEEFKMLDGSFGIKGERRTRSVGWVKCSLGNLTTSVVQELRFRNSIRFAKNGTFKYVKQKVKVKTEVKVSSDILGFHSRTIVKRKYPIKVITETLPGSNDDTYILLTNVSRSFKTRFSNRGLTRSVSNKQDSIGWMEVKDHDVISGVANTNQSLIFRNEFGCYIRTVAIRNGTVISDYNSTLCPSISVL